MCAGLRETSPSRADSLSTLSLYQVVFGSQKLRADIRRAEAMVPQVNGHDASRETSTRQIADTTLPLVRLLAQPLVTQVRTDSVVPHSLLSAGVRLSASVQADLVVAGGSVEHDTRSGQPGSLLLAQCQPRLARRLPGAERGRDS